MKDAIVITAGGTGGHVMPALALRQKLEEQDYQVIFMTDPRGDQFIPEDQKHSCTVLPLPRYQGNLTVKLRFGWNLLQCMLKCWKLMRGIRVNKVVGFGGYVTLPPLLMAILRGCTIILHEQNAIMGRVNRLIGRFAAKIALSTPTISRCPSSMVAKLVTTGLPVRPEIEALRTVWLSPKSNKFNILVLGGSQAAQFFSEIIPKTLAYLPENLQKQIKVRHQCRDQDQLQTKAAYAALKIEVELAAFFEDMPQELQAADLIFARAGASTIAEVSMVGKAVYFVPLPHAMDDHQAANAELATVHGGGWWQRQHQLQPQVLAHFLQHVIECPQILQFAAEDMRRYGQPHAATRLADVVMTLK